MFLPLELEASSATSAKSPVSTEVLLARSSRAPLSPRRNNKDSEEMLLAAQPLAQISKNITVTGLAATSGNKSKPT